MELYIINVPTTQHVVLLDDKMQLIKPVCDFLKFQQQKGRAFTLPNLLTFVTLFYDIPDAYDMAQFVPSVLKQRYDF